VCVLSYSLGTKLPSGVSWIRENLLWWQSWFRKTIRCQYHCQ